MGDEHKRESVLILNLGQEVQNLCLNRRNHPLLLAAGAVELAKNVIVHVTKSPNPRYHATKIIDILEKRRMGKKCSKESEANA